MAKPKKKPKPPQKKPAQSKPPPPKTTPGKSVVRPVLECPLQARNPCDVSKLVIKVTAEPEEKDGPPKILKLETIKVQRFWQFTSLKELPASFSRAATGVMAIHDVGDVKVTELLFFYDLIIDCIAEPRKNVAEKEKPAKILSHAYFQGRKCSLQQHALFTQTDLLNQQVHKEQKPGASELALGPFDVFAKSSLMDQLVIGKGSLDSGFKVLGIFETFLQEFSGNPASFALHAASCGIRSKADPLSPVGDLKGLVRVFRKSKWAIGLKIPPIKSYDYEKSGMIDTNKISTFTTTTETTSSFGKNRKTTTNKISGKGLLQNYDFNEKKQTGKDVESHGISRRVKNGEVERKSEQKYLKDGKHSGQTIKDKDGKYTVSDLKNKLSAEDRGFDLMVSIDDTQINVIETGKKIWKQIETIYNSINSLSQLIKKSPQLGWKIGWNYEVISGIIVVTCEPEYVDEVKADGRYYAVQHVLSLYINCKVFKIEGSLSFGIEVYAKKIETGLEVAIKGTVSFEASVHADTNLTSLKKPTLELGVDVSGSAKLAAVGYVSLFGYTVADAEVSVSTGIDFDGKFIVDIPKSDFKLKGSLRSKAGELKGYIRGFWGNSSFDPIEFFPAKTLYTF